MKTTLNTLKNQYAQEQGYEDWEALQIQSYDTRLFESHMNEICIRAQKAYGEKAAEKGCDSLVCFNSEYEILSKAITNPENLIR